MEVGNDLFFAPVVVTSKTQTLLRTIPISKMLVIVELVEPERGLQKVR